MIKPVGKLQVIQNVDENYIEKMLNHPDPSKRWRKIQPELPNVEVVLKFDSKKYRK